MGEWQPGRWYRINSPEGKLWMETSDPDEARAEARRTGWPLLRQWRREDNEWRPETVSRETED
jgi:hypothetical protein